MTSREIVKAAIHHRRPPRLPVQLDNNAGDTAFLQFKPPASFKPARAGLDEWGCLWKREDWTCGQVIEHPLKDARDLSRLSVPDFADDSRYEGAEAALRGFEARGVYVECPYPDGLLVHMARLCGFENCMASLYEDRPGVEALADKVADVCVQFIREVSRRFGGRVDGFMVIDDCATQSNGFLSLDLWMEVFHPRYKRIFDAIHGAGCDAIWHSCGNITDLAEGFVRAGADLIDAGQPRTMDAAQVARRYRDRVAFRSPIDMQATFISGDRRSVDADVERLMTRFAGPRGGFIGNLGTGGNEATMKDRTVVRYEYERFSDWSRRVYGQPLPRLERCPVCRREIDSCWCETLDKMKYIRDWHVVGPFTSPVRGQVSLEMPTPVEEAFAKIGAGRVDLAARYASAEGTLQWKPVQAPEYGVVQLGRYLGVVEWACAYGYSEIAWDRDEEVTAGIGSDDGIKIWLNGEAVYSEEAQRSCNGVAKMAKLRLRKGTNRLLLKIDNYILDWGFLLGLARE